MTDKNYTHVVLVVDRSGSMESMKKDAQESINNFLKGYEKAGKAKVTLSLYEFNNYSKLVFGPIDVKEAPQYTLHPTGGTALIDAMSRAIDETGTFLRNLPEQSRPKHVLFACITDGEENASRSCNTAQLKEKVTHQTNKYAWEFVFLGANIDSFVVASSYGFSHSVQYASTGASYKGAATATLDTFYNISAADTTLAATMPTHTNVDAQGTVTTSDNTTTEKKDKS